MARALTPFAIGPVRPRNAVFLAPLSGISDVPFRRLVRRLGAGLVVSEMVASAELVKGHPESMKRAMRDGHGPHVVQLAGRDPFWMRAAAERLAALGADVIDINMGCPAKKVVGGLSGSALMREPDLALELIEATVAGAGSVPVTLKMRLGWDGRSMNAAEIAVRAEAAGIAMVTVHGRTRQQFYEGVADWSAIAAVKAAVAIPVVANGDLAAPEQLGPMLQASGADAAMIGRGARGRPWLPALVAGEIGRPELVRLHLGDLAAAHYEEMLEHYGLEAGLRHARKHVGWYLDRLSQATGINLSQDRAAVMTATDPASVLVRLRHTLAGFSAAEAEFGELPHARREAA